MERRRRVLHKEAPLESDVLRAVCEWLKVKKYFFWRSNNIPVFGKNNAGKWTHRSLPRYTPRGLPDIMIVKDGRFIAIEVKRIGAKLRPEQAQFSLDLYDNGGIYYVVRSIEDLISIFEPHGVGE